MSNLALVNQIEQKTYNNEKVITFKDIDFVHKRPEGTASRNFRKNKKYFVEGEDFFYVKGEELENIQGSTNFVESKFTHIILITESGYLLLVKSFTDELSWKVQKMLIKGYFRAKNKQIKMFTFNEVPCTSVREIAKKYRCSDNLIQDYLKRIPLEKDYSYIMGEDLRTFKEENSLDPHISCLYVIYETGIVKVEKYLQKQGYSNVKQLEMA